MISQREANDLYRTANNNGEGFDPGIDSVEDAALDLSNNAADIILRPSNTSDVWLVRDIKGRLVAIGGDGMGNGAWACVVG